MIVSNFYLLRLLFKSEMTTIKYHKIHVGGR